MTPDRRKRHTTATGVPSWWSSPWNSPPPSLSNRPTRGRNSRPVELFAQFGDHCSPTGPKRRSVRPPKPLVAVNVLLLRLGAGAQVVAPPDLRARTVRTVTALADVCRASGGADTARTPVG
ncbi:hypothetical protein [Streptomyces sp. NPDC056600]|uniref:hypothetical protein n=1 Tax=Streptomyces sp. NPDC056600 TaxID=3345874 RepID=UPI00369888D8